MLVPIVRLPLCSWYEPLNYRHTVFWLNNHQHMSSCKRKIHFYVDEDIVIHTWYHVLLYKRCFPTLWDSMKPKQWRRSCAVICRKRIKVNWFDCSKIAWSQHKCDIVKTVRNEFAWRILCFWCVWNWELIQTSSSHWWVLFGKLHTPLFRHTVVQFAKLTCLL